METIEIRAQPGPQERFLATPADIAIYGGAAGGGKSYALLLEPLRHMHNAQFGGVVFRRTSPQLVGAGSLWEKAQTLYRPVGARLTESPSLRAEFRSGAAIQFLHLQHTSDVYDHQGKEYAFIGLDELTHFESTQFWYLVSRLRSMSGVAPYMRCTTNPDPDSFVRELISWWIDKSGRPILERSGKLRWFLRDGDTLHWGDTKDDLREFCTEGDEPMSMTFIAANLEDNPALMQADPGYRARLKALPEVERERLLGGNWDVRPEGGKYIKREYFAGRWQNPLPPLNVYMASDFAVTPAAEGKDPDCTEHGVFGVSPTGDLYVLDWWHGQTTPDVWVDSLIDKWAQFKPHCWFGEGGVIRRSVEPFLSKRSIERKVYCNVEWVNNSSGHSEQTFGVGYADRSKRAKAIRARSFQARAAAGRIRFPANAEWAARVIDQCVGFPNGKDDAFDVMSLMCLAIDETHPAVFNTAKKKDGDRYDKAFGRRNGETDWRLV